MSVVPTSSAVKEAQPLPVASISTSGSLAEFQEAKVDERADAYMALQEGEGAQPVPQSASSAGEAVSSAAAAEGSKHMAPTQDGSDEMVMESGAEEARLPDGGVVPGGQRTDAPATVTAFMMEAKEDEPAVQPISAEAVAAAAVGRLQQLQPIIPATCCSFKMEAMQ